MSCPQCDTTLACKSILDFALSRVSPPIAGEKPHSHDYLHIEKPALRQSRQNFLDLAGTAI